jgi:DNA-binding beta-propeller fold protein YncE
MRPFLLSALLVTASACALAGDTAQYGVLQKIPIGGEGGWDYLTMDSSSHHLYISRGTHVMVLDVDSGKLVGDIANTAGVHGVAVVQSVGRGFTSNGRDNTVTVFDLKTFKEITKLTVGGRPDAIFFDPGSNRVFTFNAGTTDTTAIDPVTDTVVGSVKLDGKPEFPAADGKGHVFVNIEDKSEIQEIDAKTLKVVGSWPLAPGEEPSGLAIDTKHHLLFSTCSNNILAVSDYAAKKVVGSPKIGNGPDAGAFDAKGGLAFSSNGQDGTLSIVQEGKNGAFDVVQTLTTQRGARTMAIDPRTHKIYLIAAQYEAADPAAPRGRPRMVPNSAVILVVGPTK